MLREGGIRFEPALPAPIRAALDGLPMGLLTKVALRATGADRLGLPADCRIDHLLDRAGAPFMVFHAWPRAADHVIGFIGGGAAWALAGQGPAATADFARAELVRLLGADAARVLDGKSLVTGWARDPHYRGAYAYAVPGAALARAALQQADSDGAVLLAGEAWDADGFAGTVAGAFRSGRQAAERALRWLS